MICVFVWFWVREKFHVSKAALAHAVYLSYMIYRWGFRTGFSFWTAERSKEFNLLANLLCFCILIQLWQLFQYWTHSVRIGYSSYVNIWKLDQISTRTQDASCFCSTFGWRIWACGHRSQVFPSDTALTDGWRPFFSIFKHGRDYPLPDATWDLRSPQEIILPSEKGVKGVMSPFNAFRAFFCTFLGTYLWEDCLILLLLW